MCLQQFLENGSGARAESARSFHQLETVKIKLCESDFVPLWDDTTRHHSLAEHKRIEGA